MLKIKPIELARDLGVNRSQVTRWITKRQTKPTGEAVMKLQDWTVAKFKEITKRRLTTRYQIDLAMVILNRR